MFDLDVMEEIVNHEVWGDIVFKIENGIIGDNDLAVLDEWKTLLEVEYIYDYLRNTKDPSDSTIWMAFDEMFGRQPSEDEIGLVNSRIKDGGEIRYPGVVFDSQTKMIADAYRFRYGNEYNEDLADEVTQDLYLRAVRTDEVKRIKGLIKMPAPGGWEPLYVWCSLQVEDQIRYDSSYVPLESYIEIFNRPMYHFEKALIIQLLPRDRIGFLSRS